MFPDDILVPVNRQEGDKLPVSIMARHADGTFPVGTSAYEKRGIAINVPEWDVEKCIQCNQCAFVCPHAAIRPVLLNDAEAEKIGYPSKPAMGVKDGSKFAMVISPYDCQGCGNCAQICPAPGKALFMKPLDTQLDKAPAWDYAVNEVTEKCGETPYVKLVTQLFGDRMMVANATGCSSIWGASSPSMPYTVNKKGHGPAWANSLFEDNAEYGLGMFLGVEQSRDRVEELIDAALAAGKGSADLQAAMKDWKENKNVSEGTRERADKLAELLAKEAGADAALQEILDLKQFFIKRSHWIFGGDGWSYDIGYGGLDHVLASGKNVNVLVLDTEVYSNTAYQEERPGHDGHQLWLCVCGTGFHGRRQEPAGEGADGSGSLRRPVPDHCLLPVHQPRTESRHGLQPAGRKTRCCLRLLGDLPLQSGTEGPGQESVHPGFQRTYRKLP